MHCNKPELVRLCQRFFFFLFVVLHSPFSNVSQDQLSHPVPHPFLCHVAVMTRTRGGGTGTRVLSQMVHTVRRGRCCLAPLSLHTAEERWSVTCKGGPWKCLTTPPTTKAWTHQSSAVVTHCLHAQNSWQQVEQSILSHWSGIQPCLSLLC